MKEGFSRVDVGEQFYRIDELIDQQQLPPSEEVLLVIDRLSCSPDKATVNRLSDSVQTAFLEGNGECIVRFGERKDGELHLSNRFEADGITFEEPTEMMFNFNSPMGACPKCEGFGKVMGIDESLVIPDKSLSLQEECVQCWRGEKMSEWRREFAHNAYKVDFPFIVLITTLQRRRKSSSGMDITNRTSMASMTSSECWRKTSTRYSTE